MVYVVACFWYRVAFCCIVLTASCNVAWHAMGLRIKEYTNVVWKALSWEDRNKLLPGGD